ncbi:MAG TPA: cation:proton antiporter [Solirubrobacteraceae bacterium]|nr:cation:proton antiporter [Solirubrobacteraceae bacterium]
MSTDDALLGLGLVLSLAVASQLVARLARLPAIVVLLPAGFLAGAATDVVQPDRLLGDLYQPFVSIAVGVILFEAGLRLSFGAIPRGDRRLVVRLVAVGALVTWLAVAATAALVVGGLDTRVALLIGAILVVSGPTVVLPLLAFVRPQHKVRSLLTSEAVLVDPLGALLGVFVFHAAATGTAWRPGEMLLSIAVGLLVAAVALVVLRVALAEAQREAPRQAVPVTLATVVGALVAADLIREDAGFVATTALGMALAGQRTIDVSLMLEFQQSLVQLLVGVLFILIAASVTPSEVEAVLPEALVLVAVMVLVIRPAAVALATWRSSLSLRERGFVAWMAPRGIVAGASASAFGLTLEQRGVAGAELILPIVFVVIFATVVLYGLTALPVARRLGVAGAEGIVALVVGGHDWGLEVARAVRRAGAGVRVWTGDAGEQAAARAAGLEADRGRMMVDAVNREAELDEVTDALLLTRSDDFNALAAEELRVELGHEHVQRLAPHPDAPFLVPPAHESGLLLSYAEMSERFAGGAQLVAETTRAGTIGLFFVEADGTRTPARHSIGMTPRRQPARTTAA